MVRGVAELFSENSRDMERISPALLFQENALSLLDPAVDAHNLDAANVNRAAVRKAQAETIENHHGIISGSRDGVRNGVAERVLDARESKTAASEREDQRTNETLFYLALMQDGDFVRFAAEQAFNSMTDEEVRSFIDDVEAATGKSFEDNIVEVLGPEYAKREGESDLDYARRVGPDATAEMTEIDPETGRIVAKPGYEDHPLTPFMIQATARELTNPQVQNAITMLQNGQTSAEVAAELHAVEATDQGLKTDTLREGLRQTFVASADPEQAALVAALDEDRDIGSDDDLDVDERAENTSNFLGGLGIS